MADRVTETVTGPVPAYPAPVSLPEGTVIAGRYEIRRVAGYGGFAVVYAAFDREVGREIALKLLRPDRVSDTAIKRLRREVAIARGTASRRLIRVFDVGHASEGAYLTMELVESTTLRSVLAERQLAIGEAIHLATEIAEAIRELHAMGIVHRDIKPSNLLVRDGSVIVADFGLALNVEHDESRLTQSQAVVGTLEYVPPEQILGSDPDSRSDLYSLGVVMFELVTGRLPFETQSSLATLLAHLQKPAPDVREFRPEAPRWLAHLIGGLLQKEAKARFQSAADVLEILRTNRIPLRRRITRARGWWAVTAAAAIAAGAAAYVDARRVVTFRTVGPESVAAVNRYGQMRWRIDGVAWNNGVTPMKERGRPRYVAVLRDRGSGFDFPRNHQLELRDVHSGRILRTVELESAKNVFPSFAPNFGVGTAAAVDLRGDGNDVLVVSYIHTPSWPSYTVVFDPRENRNGTILIASGHHRYAGAADINGDGRKELIVEGINNLMGWYATLAAVDVETVRAGRLTQRYRTSSTPDYNHLDLWGESPTVLWYRLLRRGYVERVDVDEPRRRFVVHFNDRRTMAVRFDGLPEGHTFRGSIAQAHAVWRSSYARLREAARLATGGFPADAIVQTTEAISEAERVGDAVLAEWGRRMLAGFLVRAGDHDAADAAYRRVAAKSEAKSEIAFDAGRAFYLGGAPERAVDWFRMGLGPEGTHSGGRGRWEFLEGIVLALGEAGAWSECIRAIDAFREQFSSQYRHGASMREYVNWRSGNVREDLMALAPDEIEQSFYWNLERRLDRGEDPATLLQALQQVKRRATDTVPMLLSLEAELLYRLGRKNDARAIVTKAYLDSGPERSRNMLVRAHYPVIEERTRRIAGSLPR